MLSFVEHVILNDLSYGFLGIKCIVSLPVCQHARTISTLPLVCFVSTISSRVLSTSSCWLFPSAEGTHTSWKVPCRNVLSSFPFCLWYVHIPPCRSLGHGWGNVGLTLEMLEVMSNAHQSFMLKLDSTLLSASVCTDASLAGGCKRRATDFISSCLLPPFSFTRLATTIAGSLVTDLHSARGIPPLWGDWLMLEQLRLGAASSRHAKRNMGTRIAALEPTSVMTPSEVVNLHRRFWKMTLHLLMKSSSWRTLRGTSWASIVIEPIWQHWFLLPSLTPDCCDLIMGSSQTPPGYAPPPLAPVLSIHTAPTLVSILGISRTVAHKAAS